MASGSYGIVRGADVRAEDVDIFIHYTPSRTNSGVPLRKLTPSEVEEMLIKVDNPGNTSGESEIFGGLYTLNLKAVDFSNNGFYSIILKPREIRTKIVSCGVLSSYPDTKGIIFDINQVGSEFSELFKNDNLIGYRVEYLQMVYNGFERKQQNYFTIITSNNFAVPTLNNDPSSTIQSTRYVFDDSLTSSLSFCTVTPASAPNVKPNAFPYIGVINQEVIITNTFFDPITIEVEMVEHDIETLAYALMANQTKSLEDGIYTIYNFNNEIYKQYDLYEIKEEFTGQPLFEIREERSGIDFTKQFNQVININ